MADESKVSMVQEPTPPADKAGDDTPKRKPDAIRVKGVQVHDFFEAGKRAKKLRELYYEILGSPSVTVKPLPGGDNFIVPSDGVTPNDQTVLFPTDAGRLNGQQRYKWVEQRDGSKYGYLTDDAIAYDKELAEDAAEGRS